MSPKPLVLAIVAASFALLTACGGSSGETPDAATGDGAGAFADGAADGTTRSDASAGDGGVGDAPSGGDVASIDGAFAQASHLPLPRVVYGGAPLLVAPKVVAITFQGDSLAPQVAAFAQAATQTAWWSTVMAGYCEGDSGACIGQGPPGVSAPLAQAAPVEFDDNSDGGLGDGGVSLPGFLAHLVDTQAVPQPDPDTMYLIHAPSTTTVAADGPGCSAFDGYHYVTPHGAQPLVYIVTMECPMFTADDVGFVASHEIAEAATDGVFAPNKLGYPTRPSGWIIDTTDPNSFPWIDVAYGEVGDLCVDYLGTSQANWTESGHSYQRIWSFQEAAANRNPCRPVPAGAVYFNAAPSAAFFELDVGESLTIEVDAFSDQPTADWNVVATDTTDPTGMTTYVNLSWATPSNAAGGVTVNNGTKAQLTIQLAKDPSGVPSGMVNNALAQYGEADVMLYSFQGPDMANATAGSYWPLAIMTRSAAQDSGIRWPDGGVPQRRVPPRKHRWRPR
jgi:hypothetical protein